MPLGLNHLWPCLLLLNEALVLKSSVMVETQLVQALRETLSEAQLAEMRGDTDSAVAKTAAIKNI
jgi:hypothetical protein